jgi:hypothetical protein
LKKAAAGMRRYKSCVLYGGKANKEEKGKQAFISLCLLFVNHSLFFLWLPYLSDERKCEIIHKQPLKRG